jgi:hypothetical protein
MPISPKVIERIQLQLRTFPGRQGYLSAITYVYGDMTSKGHYSTPLIYHYSGLRQAIDTVKWVQAL